METRTLYKIQAIVPEVDRYDVYTYNGDTVITLFSNCHWIEIGMNEEYCYTRKYDSYNWSGRDRDRDITSRMKKEVKGHVREIFNIIENE